MRGARPAGLRVRVLGAGIVGLTIAEELLRRGHAVEVVDPSPGDGASRAAAGMLSPAGEVWHGEEALYRLGRASADLWPALAERLGVRLHATGTLLAGLDAADLQEVDRQLDVLARHDVAARALTSRELRALEPRLGRVVGGALLPDDHSVDPRAVVAALRARVPVLPGPGQDRVDVTVVATGAALPAHLARLADLLAVRPVRGEVVRVRTGDPPERSVRGWVHGDPVYLVPRPPGADGLAEVVVGATSHELGGPPVPTVEGLARLLDGARRLLPGLDRAGVVEVLARDRPGTPDNLPLVGPVRPDLVVAVGHFRHGVLLAPITAALVADHLGTGRVEPALDPHRFAPTPSTGGDR